MTTADAITQQRLMARYNPRSIIPLCSWHTKLDIDYREWVVFAQACEAAGQRQRQCLMCERSLWPSEWGKEPQP